MHMKSLALLLLISGFTFADTNELKQVAVAELRWTAPIDQVNLGTVLGFASTKQITQALQTMITTSLASTRRFKVIERQDLPKLMNELEFVNDTGLEDPADFKKNPRWHKLKGIQNIVMGDITQFSVDKKGLNLGKHSLGGSSINLTIDIRVVNVETGELISAQPLTLNISRGMQARIGRDSGGFERGKGATRNKLMRGIANGIVKRIINDIEPIKVLANRQPDLILNYGEGLLKPNDVLMVYKLGEGFTIPGTTIVEYEEIEVGKVKVTHVQKRISRAKAIKGTNLASVRSGYVCRLIPKKKGFGRLRR